MPGRRGRGGHRLGDLGACLLLVHVVVDGRSRPEGEVDGADRDGGGDEVREVVPGERERPCFEDRDHLLDERAGLGAAADPLHGRGQPAGRPQPEVRVRIERRSSAPRMRSAAA